MLMRVDYRLIKCFYQVPVIYQLGLQLLDKYFWRRNSQTTSTCTCTIPYVVGVKKDNEIVGHVPQVNSRLISFFL